MNLRSKLTVIFALVCACSDLSVRADPLPDERALDGLVTRKLPESDLSKVRAGSALDPVVATHPIGVILWDEPRFRAPPVRNDVGDPRVNAQLNVFSK